MRLIPFRQPARQRLAIVALFACLSRTDCLTMAQSVTWNAPASGFVFDAQAGAIVGIEFAFFEIQTLGQMG